MGFFAFVGSDIGVHLGLFQGLQVAAGEIAVVRADLLGQLPGTVLQRLQGRFDILLVVGVLANVLADNDLMVGIDADLRIVGVIELAFLAHDPRLGIGKTDLLAVFDGFARVELRFAGFKRLFGGFDFCQPILLELQVFRDFVAGFVAIGLVFFAVAAAGLLNQGINFSA